MAQLGSVIYAVSLVLAVVLPLLLWGARSWYERVMVRSVTPTTLTSLALILIVHDGSLGLYISCGAQLLVDCTAVALLGASVLSHLLMFLFKHRYNRLLRHLTEWDRFDIGDRGASSVWKGLKACVWHLFVVPHEDFTTASRMAKMDRAGRLAELRWLLSGTGLFWLLLVLLVLAWLVAFVAWLAQGPFGICNICPDAHELNKTVAVVVLAVVYTLMGVYVALLTRKRDMYPDVWGVARQSTVACVAAVAAIVIFVVVRVSTSTSGMAWLFILGVIVLLFTQTVTQVVLGSWQAVDHRRVSKAMAVVADRNKPLVKDLPDPEAEPLGVRLQAVVEVRPVRTAFDQQLGEEFLLAYDVFLKDSRQWARLFPGLEPEERASRARKLFGQFLDDDGMFSFLRVPHAVLRKSRKAVFDVSNPEDVAQDAFVPVREWVTLFLEQGAVHRFMGERDFILAADEDGEVKESVAAGPLVEGHYRAFIKEGREAVQAPAASGGGRLNNNQGVDALEQKLAVSPHPHPHPQTGSS